MRRSLILILLAILFFSCQNKNTGNTQTPKEHPKQEERITDMKLTSLAFDEGGMIPSKYTCDGENISPPLSWSGMPEGTIKFVITCDDPDAPSGNWIHWVIYNIPPEETKIDENIPKEKSLKKGVKQGLNDFRAIGYGGPCPPSGTHRYVFKIYALNKNLELNEGVSKAEVMKAMEGSIIGEGQLTGKYKR